MALPASGGPTRRGIGRTAGSLDLGAVAPTADQEIDLYKAGVLSKFMADSILLKGPRKEAVAIIL